MEPDPLDESSSLENVSPFDQLISQFHDLEIQYAFKESEEAAVDRLFDMPSEIAEEPNKRKRISRLVYIDNITNYQFQDFLDYLYQKKNGNPKLVTLSMWVNARGAILAPVVHKLDKGSIDAIVSRIIDTYGESFAEPHLARSDLEWIVKLALLIDLGENATTQFRNSGLREQDKNPNMPDTLTQACNFFKYHIKGAAKAVHDVTSTFRDYADPAVVDIHCGTPLFALITAYLFNADVRLLCSPVKNENRTTSIIYCAKILTFLDCVEQQLPHVPLVSVKDYSFVEMLAAEISATDKRPCKGATKPSMINVLKRAPYLISSNRLPAIPNVPSIHLPMTAVALALRNLSRRESFMQKLLMCPFPDPSCENYANPSIVKKIEGVEILRGKGMQQVLIKHPILNKWVTGIMICSNNLYITAMLGIFPKE